MNPAMSFFSNLSHSAPIKFLDEFTKKRQMKKGYPETRHPFYPSILNQTMKFGLSDGNPRIGLTMSEKGAETASPECLRFIKKLVIDRFGYHEIPKNTIAISLAEANFQVGNSCQDFIPVQATNGYFSFKKLSESVQVTYFNDDNDVQYLAGTCYYPILAEKVVTCLKDESCLITQELFKREPFPLVNRSHNLNYVKHQKYGRYCSKAQARVVVWTGKDDGQIVHEKYDPISETAKNEGCSECAQDFKNYEWDDAEDATKDAATQTEELVEYPKYPASLTSEVILSLMEDEKKSEVPVMYEVLKSSKSPEALSYSEVQVAPSPAEALPEETSSETGLSENYDKIEEDVIKGADAYDSDSSTTSSLERISTGVPTSEDEEYEKV